MKPLKPTTREIAVIRLEDPETLQVVSAEMAREQTRNATEEARRLIRDGVRYRNRTMSVAPAASAV